MHEHCTSVFWRFDYFPFHGSNWTLIGNVEGDEGNGTVDIFFWAIPSSRDRAKMLQLGGSDWKHRWWQMLNGVFVSQRLVSLCCMWFHCRECSITCLVVLRLWIWDSWAVVLSAVWLWSWENSRWNKITFVMAREMPGDDFSGVEVWMCSASLWFPPGKKEGHKFLSRSMMTDLFVDHLDCVMNSN